MSSKKASDKAYEIANVCQTVRVPYPILPFLDEIIRAQFFLKETNYYRLELRSGFGLSVSIRFGPPIVHLQQGLAPIVCHFVKAGFVFRLGQQKQQSLHSKTHLFV